MTGVERFSRRETVSLIRRANCGDEAACERLIEANLPLVRSIAIRYRGRAEYEDLVQIGSLGLLKAIRDFDAEYGTEFSTFAVPKIAGEIKRFLRDDGPVKVSRRLKEAAGRISAAVEKLTALRHRPPTVEELARETGIEPCDIAAAAEAVALPRSIYEPDGNDVTLCESLEDGAAMEEEAVDRLLLEELLHELPPTERALIFLRFFREETQAETAKRLGLSQAGVSRLEAKVLLGLRERAAT